MKSMKILAIIVCTALLCAFCAMRTVKAADRAGCGERPIPPSTAEYCEELPPPGLHASVPWQVDEFTLGLEKRVVNLLHLDSYYNYQAQPRAIWGTDTYWELAVKHVPMFYNLTDSPIAGNTCQFQLLWNEPEVLGQAEEPSWIVANYTYVWEHQQRSLCYDNKFSNWGGIGSLFIKSDHWDHQPRGYIQSYLDRSGPVPTVWAIHIYASSWDHFLSMWNEVKTTLDANPQLDRPVILTEVALVQVPPPSLDEQKQFMTNLYNLIQTDSRLHSAYWFTAAGWNRYGDSWLLVGKNNKLTPLGKHFNTVRGKSDYPVYLPEVTK